MRQPGAPSWSRGFKPRNVDTEAKTSAPCYSESRCVTRAGTVHERDAFAVISLNMPAGLTSSGTGNILSAHLSGRREISGVVYGAAEEENAKDQKA